MGQKGWTLSQGIASEVMPVSAFWRDLEARFRALQPTDGDGLRANWICSAWNERGDQWYLSGIQDHRVHKTFKWLAERAAVEVGFRGDSDPVVFWLDLLKCNSPNYRDDITITT